MPAASYLRISTAILCETIPCHKLHAQCDDVSTSGTRLDRQCCHSKHRLRPVMRQRAVAYVMQIVACASCACFMPFLRGVISSWLLANSISPKTEIAEASSTMPIAAVESRAKSKAR
eukprot:2929016-Pleurochrysis_carterae.AAC.2